MPTTLDVPPLRVATARRQRPRAAVLVVDDEPAVLGLLRFLLGTSGYACLEARNATEALERARTASRIDVVLVDSDLPDMAAGALVERLREVSAEMRVVFMASSPEDRTAGSAAHAVVPKPLGAGILLRALREALSQT
jgi:CheY-like chemotaxis protein